MKMEKEKKVPKKRGRKPKGGKVTLNKPVKKAMDQIKKNIILHLKCSSDDLNETPFLSEMKYNPSIESVKAYEQDEFNNFTNVYQDREIVVDISNEINGSTENESFVSTNSNTLSMSTDSIHPKGFATDDTDQNEVSVKLKQLQKQFFHNMSNSKKSNCFWCTCPFETPTVYLPKCKMENAYEVYGCFCSPECAVAYLYREDIDTSSKWERYSLLHSLYSKIYNYEDNIKPAPDPRYLLDVFFGNLTIQEYRSIHKRPNMISILDKPITRLLPEIIESNYVVDIHDRFYQSNNNDVYKQYRLARNIKGYKPSNPFESTNNNIHVQKQFWKDIKQ